MGLARGFDLQDGCNCGVDGRASWASVCWATCFFAASCGGDEVKTKFCRGFVHEAKRPLRGLPRESFVVQVYGVLHGQVFLTWAVGRAAWCSGVRLLVVAFVLVVAFSLPCGIGPMVLADNLLWFCCSFAV